MTVLFAGDFETTTSPEKTEVWLSCLVNVEKYNDEQAYKVDTTIKDFLKSLYIETLAMHRKSGERDFIVFFHNLKFDGSFLLNFFLEKGVKCSYFINDMGVWYSITLEFDAFKITFRDSLKILNFSIKSMAQLFKMPTAKGETPLLENKPETIKNDWIEYVKTDVAILARGIYAMYFEENFSKYTSASEALSEFKRIFKEDGNHFRKSFPILDKNIDTFCRNAYRGGWTFANPIFQGKEINANIEIYDINSMYPSTMLQNPLPIGKPKHYERTPEKIDPDKYYIYHVKTAFELKPNHLPTIQVKKKLDALKIGVRTSDYVRTTNGEVIELYLTNFDYDLFNSHYDNHTEIIETLEFETESNLFDNYIKVYRFKKENAKSPAEKQKAKIMLNSLYGKFGAKIISRQKEAELSNGILKFSQLEEEEVKPVYVPIALFTTSIARHFIISNAQANYNNFLYADTDSLHLLHSDSLVLDIDPNEFGKWALEGKADKGKYLRSKLYMERIVTDDGTVLDVKGAGMTPEIKKQINFENFCIGAEFTGKRATKQINGGVHIYETTFKIKESDYHF